MISHRVFFLTVSIFALYFFITKKNIDVKNENEIVRLEQVDLKINSKEMIPIGTLESRDVDGIDKCIDILMKSKSEYRLEEIAGIVFVSVSSNSSEALENIFEKESPNLKSWRFQKNKKTMLKNP